MQLYLGPNTSAFEEEFASYCGASHAIGVGSGTEAILFSLLALGVGPGDEVITVSHTFIATVEAIDQTGATPVLVDINPELYTIDPAAVEQAITGRTKVIVPVHLYGQPADTDPLLRMGKTHGLAIVEDACQAHGAEYRGRRVGSLGDFGCFSFYCSKNLGAYGEAGMVVTNDEELAERVRLIRNHGQESRYSHSLVGYNGRLDEIQAAILRVKLRYLDEWNAHRRGNADVYNRLLSDMPVVRPVEAPYARHVYHLYVIRSPCREQIRSALEQAGIGTGIHYPVPIHRQPVLRRQAYAKVALQVTESIANEVLSLPMYPELTEEQIAEVASLVIQTVEAAQ
jgi:dTDP-4-amino-4,6-dideoxygalactose transaminase